MNTEGLCLFFSFFLLDAACDKVMTYVLVKMDKYEFLIWFYSCLWNEYSTGSKDMGA